MRLNTGRQILIAEIRQAHGLKGEVRLQAFTENPQSLIQYSPLLTASGTEVIIERLKPAKGAWLATLKNIRDRNASEALQGEKLYLPRERLPQLPEGQWYQADLVGLSLLNDAGVVIGRIEAFVNYGGGDLLEVAIPSKTSTVLVPFNQAKVDLAKGTIHVAMAEGLLED